MSLSNSVLYTILISHVTSGPACMAYSQLITRWINAGNCGSEHECGMDHTYIHIVDSVYAK